MIRNLLLRPALAAAMLATATAFASGFNILEQSTVGLGRSLAGMTAETDDPGAAFFNPAATAWHERPTLMMGLHGIFGSIRYHDQGSAIGGNDGGNIYSPSFVPNLYYVHPIDDKLTFNLGMSATSGTSTVYNNGWVGRYHSLQTEIKVIENNLSLNYALSEELAVGLGLIIQYAEATMSQALPLPYGLPDGQLKLQGDSWSFGYDLGLLYQPAAKTRIGLGYRSKIEHNVDFRARYRFPQGFPLGTRRTEDAEATLNLPACVNFGLQQDVTERLTLMGDISWTQWSDMDKLKVDFDKGILGVKSSSETMQWRDTWRFAVGGDYRLNDKWTLRTGVCFDQTPVRAKDKRSTKLPDTNRIWVSCGASYQIRENLRLDGAWTHLFLNRAEIRHPGMQGYYTGYVDIISLGLNYQF